MTNDLRFFWHNQLAILPFEHRTVTDFIIKLQPSYKSHELTSLANQLTSSDLKQIIQLTSIISRDHHYLSRLKDAAIASDNDSEEKKTGSFALACFLHLLSKLAQRTDGSEINEFVQALSKAPSGAKQGPDSIPPGCAYLLPLAKRFAWLRVGSDDHERVVSSLSESELSYLRSIAQAAYEAGHVHAILKFPSQKWSSDTADLANLVSILSHTGGFPEHD